MYKSAIVMHNFALLVFWKGKGTFQDIMYISIFDCAKTELSLL